VKGHSWALLVALLGVVVLGAAVFLGGEAQGRLLSWWHGWRTSRATLRAEATKAQADGLDAQRGRLLHEATRAAKARAQLQERDQDVREEMAAEEERIRAMSADEVAAEFNRLKERNPSP